MDLMLCAKLCQCFKYTFGWKSAHILKDIVGIASNSNLYFPAIIGDVLNICLMDTGQEAVLWFQGIKTLVLYLSNKHL